MQFLVLGFCMGSCVGFGVPIAKYFGAGDLEKMRTYVFHGALLTAGIAVVITTACIDALSVDFTYSFCTGRHL